MTVSPVPRTIPRRRSRGYRGGVRALAGVDLAGSRSPGPASPPRSPRHHPSVTGRGMDECRQSRTSATARRPATSASWTMSAVFARTDAPPVSSAIRARSHGVSAGPVTCGVLRVLRWRARSRRARRPRAGRRPRAPACRRGSAEPSPSPRCVRDDLGGRGLVRRRRRGGDAARAAVEARQVRLADREDRHAVGLEVLEGEPRRRGSPSGPAHTTATGVRASSSRSELMSRDGAAPPIAPAMDAADPAGREHPDPRRVGRDHRRPDGRGRPAARGERGGEARSGDLADRAGGRRGERLEVRVRQADEEPSVADRDGRRDGPGRADGRLRRAGDLDVLRIRQAVADERRLEGHDRPAVDERVGHLRARCRGDRGYGLVGHRRSVPDAVRPPAADRPATRSAPDMRSGDSRRPAMRDPGQTCAE